MLEESVALLRNVYRSKHILGENLKYADPCYTTDFVGQFNLATPPVFDPSFSANAAVGMPSASNQQRPGSENTNQRRGSSTDGAGAENNNNQSSSNNAEIQNMREKLRTAEELVKKLYRRNTQLETENQFVKAELFKLEKLHGLARSKQSSLTVIDGHLPCDHPTFTKRMRRNCRSVPPQRTLMRTAVGGFGLSFPKRASAMDGNAGTTNQNQDPPAVMQLKRRVLQLSEALVAVQHDNEVLLQERGQRNVLRDRLLHRYLVERDTGIAQLHAMLQELLAKVSNPMRLLRTKQQPSLNMNPVVAAQNILRDASSRLAEQVQLLSNDIMKKSGSALPSSSNNNTNNADGEDDEDNNNTNTNNNNNNNEGGNNINNNGGNDNGGVVTHGKKSSLEDVSSFNRRRELALKIQNMAEALPLNKRKNFVNTMVELRALFNTLTNSNHALLSTFEEERDAHHTQVVKLKMHVAVLKDQLRAMGVREEEIASIDGLGLSDSQDENDE